MKIPKRIVKLLTARQEYIDTQRDKLERFVLRSQNKYVNALLKDVYVELDVVDGKITDSVHNYRVLNSIDSIEKTFNRLFAEELSGQIIGTTTGLIELGRNYFAIALTEELGARFEKVVSSTAAKMDLRIGVKGGKIVRGGFLESMISNNSVETQVKNFISKSIAGQINTKDFISGLSNMITGGGDKGALEKQYSRFAYDLYQQYDAAYNSSLAEEFDMNYFIYQGGLIDASRDFCAAHNNKVFHRSEADDWYTWTPAQGEYPPGYEVKSKNIYEVPSYLDYPGYQPLIDRGGYNCRHMIGWISDTLAKDLRDDLPI